MPLLIWVAGIAIILSSLSGLLFGVATDRSRRLNANDESSGTLV
jgi:hypothetical protein